jgi:MFS family permease
MPMVHIVAHCSDLGFDPRRGADMLAILLFCAFLSRICYGWLADRIGSLSTLLMGCSLQLVGLALFSTVDSLEALYAVSVFYGLGYGGIVPMYALIVRELFPQRELGWRIGVIFLFGTSGMAAGGYLGGLIFDLSGTYGLAFLVGMLFNLANVAILSALVWRSRDPDAALAGAPA